MARTPTAMKVLLVATAAMVASMPAWADEPSVPLQLQVELTAKVMEYVQRPAVQSLDRVRIGIVVKSGDPESTNAGAELKAAFDRLDAVGRLPHEQLLVEWSGAKQLAEVAVRRQMMVLYFAPSLDGEIAAVAQALTGQGVVTIAAVASYVRSGVMLGFELVSGHPKMVFNLAQAKRQGVALSSTVMKLMRIVQ